MKGLELGLRQSLHYWVETLYKYYNYYYLLKIDNIKNNPDQEKFRKINLANANIIERIVNCMCA